MVVLDKVSQDVQEAMDLDEKALQEALTGKDYADRYLPKIRQTYADFKAQVAAENNISHILGYKDKSASRSQYFQEAFDREDEAIVRRQTAKSSPKAFSWAPPRRRRGRQSVPSRPASWTPARRSSSAAKVISTPTWPACARSWRLPCRTPMKSVYAINAM